MARIRTLKPEIVSDVKLSAVSMQAELTFIRLITQSDDVGLVAGAPRQLLGALYPLRDSVTVADLLGWIEELVDAGIVRWRETTDGSPVVELCNWSKHQRIDNAGRSQLATLLKSVAEVRGDSPQAAEVRRLDLGPRTPDPLPPIVREGGRQNGNGKRPSTLEVGEIINTLKALAQRPLVGSTRIPKAAVEQTFPPPTVRAIYAIGLGRFLKDDDDYLLRDLTSALYDARTA